MAKFDYDLIVIGGGAGGLVSAKLAKGLGKKVAIVERNKMGGECTWTGCVPSKALIACANTASKVKKFKNFGLSTTSGIELSTAGVMNYVHHTVDKIYSTHTPETIKKLGIDVFIGCAQFLNNHKIKINDQKISAKKFIIATGSSPLVPQIPGIDKTGHFTNQTFFDLKQLPKSIAIVGGGPIGIEIACALNKLGTQVTILEIQDNILAREDKELSEILSKKLSDEGIQILTKATIENVEQQNNQVFIPCSIGNEKHIVKSAELLIATGRKPNIDDLNLEQAGVKYNKKGIITNNKMQTSASNIYACGDVVGPYQFSHMAEYQAIIATKNAFLPISTKADYSQVLWVTYSDPEFARCGLTEQEAKELHGNKIKIYKHEFKALDRSVIDQNETGMVKIICNKKNKIIGAHILGERAGELIHEIAVGKKYNISFAKFDKVIHAYPTYSEAIKKAARKNYIDKLQSNFLLKLIKTIFKK